MIDETSSRAYVGLGSNLGNRAGNLLLAVRGMMNAGMHVRRLARIYETAPVGVLDQPPFLNTVAELTLPPNAAPPTPEVVLARLLRIEYAIGRRRTANDTRDGARPIDLDLLLYDAHVQATDFLQLPHPRLHLRRFVLVPLAELAADTRHPTLQYTIAELLAMTPDTSAVALWQSNETNEYRNQSGEH